MRRKDSPGAVGSGGPAVLRGLQPHPPCRPPLRPEDEAAASFGDGGGNRVVVDAGECVCRHIRAGTDARVQPRPPRGGSPSLFAITCMYFPPLPPAPTPPSCSQTPSGPWGRCRLPQTYVSFNLQSQVLIVSIASQTSVFFRRVSDFFPKGHFRGFFFRHLFSALLRRFQQSPANRFYGF